MYKVQKCNTKTINSITPLPMAIILQSNFSKPVLGKQLKFIMHFKGIMTCNFHFELHKRKEKNHIKIKNVFYYQNVLAIKFINCKKTYCAAKTRNSAFL